MDKFSWIKRNLYLIIIIVVAVYLIIDLNTRLSTLNYLEDQEQTLEADVVNLQSTLDTVNDRIDYSNSDTAVEEWARQQGLMRQEDDHVILPLPVNTKRLRPPRSPRLRSRRRRIGAFGNH